MATETFIPTPSIPTPEIRDLVKATLAACKKRLRTMDRAPMRVALHPLKGRWVRASSVPGTREHALRSMIIDNIAVRERELAGLR